MTFEMKVYMDSDAFQDGFMEHELMELLEIASARIMSGEMSGSTIDTSGNTVGSWAIKE